MLKLSGCLTIRTIDGRNGPFNVGRLVTEIGEFAVKESLLDQYEPGRYEGDFGLSRIFPSYYLASGRLVVEVRATVETMALAGIDPLAPEDTTPEMEPDPLEETPTPRGDTKGDTGVEERVSPEHGITESDPDVALFGELWPLAEEARPERGPACLPPAAGPPESARLCVQATRADLARAQRR
jgi:hypothetical protein